MLRPLVVLALVVCGGARVVAQSPVSDSLCGPPLIRVELRRGLAPEVLWGLLGEVPPAVVSVRGRAGPGGAWTVVLDAHSEANAVADWIRQREAEGIRFVGLEPAPCPGEIRPAMYGGTFEFTGVVALVGNGWHVETAWGAYEMTNLPRDLHQVGLRIVGVAETDRAAERSLPGASVARLLSVGLASRDPIPGASYRPGAVSVTPRRGVSVDAVLEALSRYPYLSVRPPNGFWGGDVISIEVTDGEEEAIAVLVSREAPHRGRTATLSVILHHR